MNTFCFLLHKKVHCVSHSYQPKCRENLFCHIGGIAFFLAKLPGGVHFLSQILSQMVPRPSAYSSEYHTLNSCPGLIDRQQRNRICPFCWNATRFCSISLVEHTTYLKENTKKKQLINTKKLTFRSIKLVLTSSSWSEYLSLHPCNYIDYWLCKSVNKRKCVSLVKSYSINKL